MSANVVWFQIDGLRPEFLEVTHEGRKPTTFLDELVSAGEYFGNCISAAPYTIASEVSMFTGFYPHVHGLDGWFKTSPDAMRRPIVTFVDVLKASGYSTIAIYESAVRAYAPPYSFDEYHMLTPEDPLPLDRYGAMPEPRFLFCQLASIHNTCVSSRGSFRRRDYREAVEGVSEQVESIHREHVRRGDVVIVASDHGLRCVDEPEGHQKEYVTGRYVTDKTIQVFFSISMPSIGLGGGKHSEMVRTIDVAPTLLDLLGLDELGAQGRSVRPVLEGREWPVKHAIAQTGGMITSPWKPDTWCIRTSTWKYVLTRDPVSGAERDELYHLREDPDELENVWSADVNLGSELKGRLTEEVFGETFRPVDFYRQNDVVYGKMLSARTYPLDVRLQVWYRNLKYRWITRSGVRLKLFRASLRARIARGWAALTSRLPKSAAAPQESDSGAGIKGKPRP